jgi:hypothetical protein
MAPYTRDIVVANQGNKDVTLAGLAGASSPLFIDTASATIPFGTQRTYTVRCESPTAMSTVTQPLTLTGAGAYVGNNQIVTADCTIADTLVQVMPQTFDFGEVRTGSPSREITVIVTNPASSQGSAHVKRVALAEPRVGLTLNPPATNVMLSPGQNTTAQLQLTTAVDSDLAGERLEVEVDSVTLSFPVTGKVVTASSRVVPEILDLGTACLGTEVEGSVAIVNDGTATLQVLAPQLDQNFLATSAPGTTYPATLAPIMSISATVEPSASSGGGLMEGTLTWDDDVPSHYVVPVKLDYITKGTAISPASLDFGVVEVDMPTLPKSITLENCELTPGNVTVQAINTKTGPVGAWVIMPPLGHMKVLAANERQAVSVTFRPPARGRYEADLVLVTNGGPKNVRLIGDALGRDFEKTSFYACACAGGTPAGGWPIALAVLVIVRRRRGSSSAR